MEFGDDSSVRISDNHEPFNTTMHKRQHGERWGQSKYNASKADMVSRIVWLSEGKSGACKR